MTPPKRANPKRCGAKRMPNLAAMRRQARREASRIYDAARSSSDPWQKSALAHKAWGIEWVLEYVLTTPKPNRKRGGK